MADLLSDRIIQAPTYQNHYLGEHGYLERINGIESQREKIHFDGREKRRGINPDTAFKTAQESMDHFDKNAELLIWCGVCDKAIKTKAVNRDIKEKKDKKKKKKNKKSLVAQMGSVKHSAILAHLGSRAHC